MDSFFFKNVTCRKLTWKFKGLLFLGFVLVCFLLHQPILSAIGGFLAVGQSHEESDVLIVEGTNVVNHRAYETAIQLYEAGVGKEVLFALHRTGGTYYGVNNFTDAYVDILKQELDSKGIPNGVVLLFDKHPVTLKSGEDVAEYFRKNRMDVKSVTLISHGFHTRRSFLSYRNAFQKLGIQVYAFGYFGRYDKSNWWQSADGFRTLVSEYLKYGYYVVRGWI